MIEYETKCPSCERPYFKTADPKLAEDYKRIAEEVGGSAESCSACCKSTT